MMNSVKRHPRLTALATLLILLASGVSPAVAPAQAQTNPSARYGNAMATDPATGKLVMFGGRDRDGLHNDTWTWNGSAWARPVVATSPPAREYAVMAEDPTTGTVVLFGGNGTGTGDVLANNFNDTWIWDGRTKTWTNMRPLVSPPSDGLRKAMAYDAASGKVVLFTDGLILDDPVAQSQTWTWDGGSRTWTQENPPVSPLPRDNASMAYDAVARRVVLFGGLRGHCCVGLLDDTWTWDGITKTWSQEAPTMRPSPREDFYMAYHAASAKIVLFGGFDGTNLRDDTWTWDGQARTWTKQKPITRPCGRARGAMAYHASTSSAVIFGGASTASGCPPWPASDTWAWNGTSWMRRA